MRPFPTVSCRFRRLVLLVVGGFLATSSGVFADGAPRTHDGQFLHVAYGMGWMWTSADLDGENFDFNGFTFDGELSLGGMLRENLALHGTFFNWIVINPTVQSESSNTDVAHTGFAFGTTYYFMPVNLFASVRVGGGWMRQQRAFGGYQHAAKTDFGLAGGVGLGKEWWVSDNWGVGIAGSVDFHSLPSADFDGTFNGSSFAIRFSATYN